ncbi:DUF2922 domain-containing protein [Clostridium sp.]|uniref:DUF2922 domain-containing protein n=1 Tax=Clostridium sp. TaxID=1506 RepID=UPI00261A1B84|nr:DUF2922 domain-containing protein [Clostridium sp.]
MLERTATLSFKNAEGKTHNLILKDIKEDVEELDITDLMDSIISKNLIKTEKGDLIVKNAAYVVTKETNEVEL